MNIDNNASKLNKSSPPQWLLYTSIGIIVFSIIIEIVFFSDIVHHQQEKDPLLGYFTSYPIIILFVKMCLVAPVFEELGFRGWLYDKKFYKLLSFIFLMVYSIMSFGYIIGISVALIHGIMLINKFIAQHRVISVLYTSALFSLVHFGNYGSVQTMIAPLINIMGSGMVLSFITWRYSLTWSMVMHALWNGLILLSVVLFSEKNEIITSEYTIRSDYKVRIEKKATSFEDKTITAESNLNDIVHKWIKNYDCPEDDCLYVSTRNTPNLELSIKMTDKANKSQILDTLISTYGYALDTSYYPKYMMTLPDGNDTIKVSLSDKGEMYKQTLDNFLTVLKDHYQISIDINDAHKERILMMHPVYVNKTTAEDILNAAEKSGIVITKDTTQTIMGLKLVPIKN